MNFNTWPPGGGAVGEGDGAIGVGALLEEAFH